jgi:hypothetical protein
MSDASQFKIPGWLRDAAGAPPSTTPGAPAPKRPGWKALLRWLAERLLADRS